MLSSLPVPSVVFGLLLTSGIVLGEERTIVNFDGGEAGQTWRTVNDGVMGGRSDGRFELTADGSLRFFGTLSLKNNGGFASVRVQPLELDLKPGETLVLRVLGDGREYSMNLYVPRRFRAFSYRTKFKTEADKWTEVGLPLADFVATSFGRVVRNQPLKPSEVNGLGILLGDKKAGPFELKVDWIKVKPAVE